MSEKITCRICGAQTHVMQRHLLEAHNPDGLDAKELVTNYRATYPDAPMLSPEAQAIIQKQQLQLAAAANVVPFPAGPQTLQAYSVFGMSPLESLAANGQPIMITVLSQSAEWADLLPDRDPRYIFEPLALKNVLMGLEYNIPTYLYGHAGTGKTTIVEQVCHHTRRPMLRVQHTANMIEEDLTGRWIAVNGSTRYIPGPLTSALKHGWVLLVDEYDFAVPEVLSVYQPVLEGKPLVIKDADEEHRIVRPHPNFRIIATGNTNGSGDDTGLYPGRPIQDAANFSRFGITYEIEYMPRDREIKLVQGQSQSPVDDVEKLVDFANEIRAGFRAGRGPGRTIGPRELIFAAKISALYADLRLGVAIAITNRWSQVDREIGTQIAQRHLG